MADLSPFDDSPPRRAVIAWLLIAAVMVGCTLGGWIVARATGETCETADV